MDYLSAKNNKYCHLSTHGTEFMVLIENAGQKKTNDFGTHFQKHFYLHKAT